jgi:hypothetical protein
VVHPFPIGRHPNLGGVETEFFCQFKCFSANHGSDAAISPPGGISQETTRSVNRADSACSGAGKNVTIKTLPDPEISPHMVVFLTPVHNILLFAFVRRLFTGSRQWPIHRYSQPKTRTAFNQ